MGTPLHSTPTKHSMVTLERNKDYEPEPLSESLRSLQTELDELITTLRVELGEKIPFLLRTLNIVRDKFTLLEQLDNDIPRLEEELHMAKRKRTEIRKQLSAYEDGFRSHVREMLQALLEEDTDA